MKTLKLDGQFKRVLSAFLFSFFLLVGAGAKSSSGIVHVNGYTKKDGTYVAPYDRTAPNNTKDDNWSTKGNVNPETGKAGTKPGDGTGGSNANSSAVQSGATGWSAMKSGPKDSEVTKQLGAPKDVQKKNGYEIWKYPTGIVYVKEGKVVGWRQDKSQ